VFKFLSKHAREKRAAIFRQTFFINEDTKILDLGSENGSNINAVLNGINVSPQNVYIADINPKSVSEGNKQFGFIPVHFK